VRPATNANQPGARTGQSAWSAMAKQAARHVLGGVRPASPVFGSVVADTDYDLRMIEDIGRDIDAIVAQMVEWRRDFHRHPELSLQEHRTSAVVRAFLEQCGMEVSGCGGTGVRGVLKGAAGGGPTVALRADMDALAIDEESDVPYRSQVPGAMHACGHDGHMAILMGVAKVLAARRASLPGSVVFLFQPSEENHPGGAKTMIEEGALDGVDAIFGLHLWQSLPTGIAGTRPGPLMAQSDTFTVAVNGRGGHASQPHMVVDPVLAAAHLVVTAQSIASRSIDPRSAVVVSFSMVHGGSAHNIIPDTVNLTGTVRTFDALVQRTVKQRLREVCEHTCGALGATSVLDYVDGYPPLVNDAGMTALVRNAAAREIGANSVVEIEPVMGGEDFAYYLQRVPGAFVLFGAGDGMAHPHHNARFDIDERALPLGARLMTAVALDALSGVTS
jgi:amidohydrolase